MKTLTLTVVALVLVFSISAQSKKKKDAEAIKEMCGCFEVTFNFAETLLYNWCVVSASARKTLFCNASVT